MIDPDNSDQCINCSYGWYQSDNEPGLDTNCTQCDSMMTTAREGAVADTECIRECRLATAACTGHYAFLADALHVLYLDKYPHTLCSQNVNQ